VSLYRKWRSRSFDDLYGQDHVVRTLRNAVRTHTVAHAYLFTGPRGTGKTSTARILARAVNCLAPRDGNPCNECVNCLAALEGRAMDVIEIDAASNTSVDNVRELRERVAFAAGEGAFKVYIVDEVHRLSGAAFDAFLKTLEEPPEHVIFVFASTEPHKVPATIASRCQRFDFHRIGPDVILTRIRSVAEAEGMAAEEDALLLVARGANGSLRDALGLLEQAAAHATEGVTANDVRAALGLSDPVLVARLTSALLDRAVAAGLNSFREFVDQGGDPQQLTTQLLDYWRALLLQVVGSSGIDLIDPALESDLRAQAARLNAGQVVRMVRALTDAEFSPRFNVPAGLPFEVGYLQAAISLDERPVAPSPPVEAAAPPIEDSPPAAPAPAAERPAAIREVSPTASGGSARAAWKDVIAAMRRHSPTLQAVLRSSFVVEERGDEVTIGFPYDFHRDVFAEAAKRRILEGVVSDVLGEKRRVICIRANPEDSGVSDDLVDDGFVAEVAEQLRQYHAREFNGRS